MFALFDTHNRRIVSKHRSIDAAAFADIKLQKQVDRRNPGCYVPTALKRIVKGELVNATEQEVNEFQERKTWHP